MLDFVDFVVKGFNFQGLIGLLLGRIGSFLLFMRLIFILISFLSCMTGLAYGLQADPCPEALLVGLRTAREELIPTEINGVVTSTGKIASNSFEITVRFDGNRRIFQQNWQNDNLNERTVVDGDRVLNYYTVTREGEEVRGRLTIYGENETVGSLSFDPRVLGITPSLNKRSATLLRRIPIENAQSIHLIGEESIDNRTVFVVGILDEYDQLSEFWIDPENEFQVVRYSFENLSNPQFGRVDVRSEYNIESYPWLPSKLESVHLSENGELIEEVSIKIESAVPIEIDEEEFTIAGIKPARGTQVIDNRTGMRLGYWDGDGGFVDAIPVEWLEDFDPGIVAVDVTSKDKSIRLIIVTLLAVAFLIPLIVLSKRDGKNVG